MTSYETTISLQLCSENVPCVGLKLSRSRYQMLPRRNVPGVRFKEEGSGLSRRYVQFRPHFLIAVHLPQIRSLSRQVVNAGSVVANTGASFPKSSFCPEHESTRITRKMRYMSRVNEAETCTVFLYFLEEEFLLL